MKQILIYVLLIVCVGNSTAQTNTFPSSGNVGIGTTSPQYPLEVVGHISAGGNSISGQYNLHTNRGRLAFSNTAGDWNHTIYNNWANIDGEGMWDGMKMNVYAGLNIRIGNAYGQIPKSAFYLDNDGLVGIGTMKTLYANANSSSEGGKDILMLATNTYNSYKTVFIGFDGYSDNLGNNVSSMNSIIKNTAEKNIRTSAITFGTSSLSENLEEGYMAFYVKPSGVNSSLSEVMRFNPNMNVGIGTTTPSEKLSVNGNIRSKKLIVTQSGWPDYVFNTQYKLPSLLEVEKFIKKNNHLSEVPSAKQVEEKGLDVGETQAVLLKKIEELTLYMIELKKDNEQLKIRVNKLEVDKVTL
jgi:hypothetical protein